MKQMIGVIQLVKAEPKIEAMPPATLEQLLAQVAQGQMEAFARLYDITSPRLFAIAFRILRDEAVAQDATQEAYVNIWRKAKLYDPARGSPIGWMSVIVRNVALNMIRADRPTEPIDDLASVRARGVISGVGDGVFLGGACPTQECGIAGGHRAHRYGGVCTLQP